jgi:CPA1 family monovalent cation:H+ antiporter
MEVLPLILLLLVAVTLLSIAARRIHLPYPTVMVVGGLLISLVPNLPHVEAKPELLMILFLPPLLYAAAWQTSWRDFRANLRPIILLAVGFVAFTTFIVGGIAHWMIPGMTWAAAIALGAIISPPDAIAAVAITDRLGVPKRIVTILEGESLVNDASGLALYSLAVSAAVTGQFSMSVAAGRLVLITCGGIAVGLLLGLLVAQLHKRLDDAPAETIITILTPYTVYIAADAVGASGVLAVVSAGLYVSRRSSQLFSSSTRMHAYDVWELLVFVLNGLVFILIGLQLPFIRREIHGHSLMSLIAYSVVLTLIVMVVRLLWIYPATYIPRWLSKRVRQRDPAPPWQNVMVIAYTAMRGVVSLAAALALPQLTASEQPFPQRGLIIFLTFSVIVATVVVQTLTLPALIRWLGLRADQDAHCEEWEARLQAAQAALARIDELAARPGEKLDDHLLSDLRHLYHDRIDRLNRQHDRAPECSGHHDGKPGNGRDEDEHDDDEVLMLAAIDAERQKVLELRDHDIINDSVLRKIERDLDLEELRLRG